MNPGTEQEPVSTYVKQGNTFDTFQEMFNTIRENGRNIVYNRPY